MNGMITHEEAIETVKAAAKPIGGENIPLRESCGRILAMDVFSDVDMPPFNKSAVDGYACRRQDLGNDLQVLEVIPAGKMPQYKITEGTCSKLMTGGMVPQGADTVLMVEDTQSPEPGKIRFTASATAANIAFYAEDVRKGDKVLAKGVTISPQHIAVLASVGCTHPLVAKKPTVGIISTGDELVEPHINPSEAQIRNSNSWQLIAQAEQAGCRVNYYGIAVDTENAILDKINQAAAENNIVVLTGGVSVGDFDFVPVMIEKAGFEIKFRTMAVQPGKPAIFATRGNVYLFGLPGNPVSAFVQFHYLTGSLIRQLTGNIQPERILKLPVGTDIKRKKTHRKTLIPVKLGVDGKVYPVEYHGSAHIHSFVFADGILALEIGQAELPKDTFADVRLL